jgi:Outer membrane protein beta-barrel domain
MMRLTTATLALSLALGATAQAAEPRSHDGGFFLRVAPGLGFARSKIAEAGDELELRGLSGNADIAIGAVVTKNLAIHANLGGWSVVDPTLKFNGEEEQFEDASISLFSYGAGFTWYFGTSNVYVTAWGGAAELDFEFEGENETSDTGFAFEVGVGKEWWVSDRWGLGVSASAGYHSVPPGDAANDFKGPSFAVRFSATLN